MGTYTADLEWVRGDQDFLGNEYSRRHRIRFDGGVEIAGSSSPHVVPVPRSDPSAVDPEEAFVAAVSSCHMLTFLAIAARKRLVVDRYEDDAVGHLEKNADGKLAITRVTLRPRIAFGGKQPGAEELERLHHAAHENCFIANSVRTEISVEFKS